MSQARQEESREEVMTNEEAHQIAQVMLDYHEAKTDQDRAKALVTALWLANKVCKRLATAPS